METFDREISELHFLRADGAGSHAWSVDNGRCGPVAERLLMSEVIRPQAKAFLAAVLAAVGDDATLGEPELAELIALAGCAPSKLPAGQRDRFNDVGAYNTVHPAYSVRYAAELLAELSRP